MANNKKMDKKAKEKREKMNNRLKKSGLVYLLQDLNIIVSEGLLEEITELYERGKSAEEIGEEINRDPDEIFIALFHQSRQGKITRPFAYRI